MNYAQAQRNPGRNLTGIGIVVALHVLIVWAVTSGLARKVIEVVKPPIEAKVIEEIKPPPPPPEIVTPPPPKMEAPPPPFIPPPEVQIAAPPPVQPTITVQQTTPPPPTDIRPLQPTVTAPPAPAQAGPVSASVVCSNYSTVMGEVAYPREAERQGIEKGEATIQFTVGPTGAIKDIKVIKSTNSIFARSSVRIVGAYKCQGQGRDVLVQVPFGYKLE